MTNLAIHLDRIAAIARTQDVLRFSSICAASTFALSLIACGYSSHSLDEGVADAGDSDVGLSSVDAQMDAFMFREASVPDLPQSTPDVGADLGTPIDSGTPLDLGVPHDVVPFVHIDNAPRDTAITITIPPQTIGFQVIAQISPPRFIDAFGIESIVDPFGVPVHENYSTAGQTDASGLNVRDVASAVVPRSNASTLSPLPAGEWTVTIGTDGLSAEQTISLDVYVQSAEGSTFAGGELDLAVYFAPGVFISDSGGFHELDVTSAPTDFALQARLDGFFDALSALFGIGRGSVSFHSLPAEFSSITDFEQLYDASELTDDASHSEVRLVIVNDLTFEGFSVWGVSTGLPGAGPQGATPVSAVFMDFTSDATWRADGVSLLHEMGHFFGLNHTSEFSGDEWDPLDDTPACSTLPRNLLACPDFDNLMFPTSDGTDAMVLEITSTAQQRTVVQGSPVYRATSSVVPFSARVGERPFSYRVDAPTREGGHLLPCGHALRSAHRSPLTD